MTVETEPHYVKFMLPEGERTRPLAAALLPIHGKRRSAEILYNLATSKLVGPALSQSFLDACVEQANELVRMADKLGE